MCPRSDLGCPVEYQSDLGCFGHVKVMYFHVVYSVFNDANEYKSPTPPLTNNYKMLDGPLIVSYREYCKPSASLRHTTK
jgi:hypothetical protein